MNNSQPNNAANGNVLSLSLVEPTDGLNNLQENERISPSIICSYSYFFLLKKYHHIYFSDLNFSVAPVSHSEPLNPVQTRRLDALGLSCLVSISLFTCCFFLTYMQVNQCCVYANYCQIMR